VRDIERFRQWILPVLTVVLILGRFADGHLCEGVVWEFNSIDLWHGWAPSLFARERH
jgi:hypothetical protein